MDKMMKRLAVVIVLILAMAPSNALGQETVQIQTIQEGQPEAGIQATQESQPEAGIQTTEEIPTVAAVYEEGADEKYEGYIVKLEDVRDCSSVDQIPGTDMLGSDLVVADDLATVRDMAAQADIAWVEPNYVVELFDSAAIYPNDPYYADATDYQWNLKAIDAASAWTRGLFGSGATIAVIDSGLVSGHEDIDYERVIDGQNFNTDGLPYTTDNTSHGSFLTGLMAARLDNGKGLAGISPVADIMPLRCFSSSTGATISMIIEAINYAIAHQADVINMSFGTAVYSPALKTACDNAVAADIILIAAVGNYGNTTLMYPAAFESVIGVGSLDNNGGSYTVSAYSQRNESVFATAPAGGVISIGTASFDDYELDYTDNSNKGTSYAAPVVSALAAMAKGFDSDMTPDTFKDLMRETAVDLGSEGYDVAYGYGMVSAGRMAAALDHQYGIVYALNDATGPSAEMGGTYPTSYSLASETLTLPVPTRAGYVFGGWYASADFSGQAVEEIREGTVGDLVFSGDEPTGGFLFYAKWQAIATNSPPTLLEGQAVQSGTAVPASYDGLTEAVLFTTDAALWFSDAQSDDLTYLAADSINSGKISFSGSRLTVTPDITDAEGMLNFQIYADDGFALSTPASLTISVGSVPGSSAILSPETATYDLYSGNSRHEDITVDLLTYNNTLEGIREQENGLTLSTDYMVSYDNLIGQAVIKSDYLSKLAAGNYILIFDFSGGTDPTLTLTVVDTTPTPEDGGEDADSEGSESGGGGGGEAAVVSETPPVLETMPEEAPVVIPFDEVTTAGQQAVTQLFGDVIRGSWYVDSIQFVYSRGLFQGVGGGRFAPEAPMSRGMFVTVLSRLAAVDTTRFTAGSFEDVQADDWYGPAVGWAVANGLASGYNARIFGSQDSISREQMVVMLYRYAGWAGLGLGETTDGALSYYLDREMLSTWATEAMTWAVSKGIINGKQGNRLDPQGMTTRAEVAAILQRFVTMTESR